MKEQVKRRAYVVKRSGWSAFSVLTYLVLGIILPVIMIANLFIDATPYYDAYAVATKNQVVAQIKIEEDALKKIQDAIGVQQGIVTEQEQIKAESQANVEKATALRTKMDENRANAKNIDGELLDIGNAIKNPASNANSTAYDAIESATDLYAMHELVSERWEEAIAKFGIDKTGLTVEQIYEALIEKINKSISLRKGNVAFYRDGSYSLAEGSKDGILSEGDALITPKRGYLYTIASLYIQAFHSGKLPNFTEPVYNANVVASKVGNDLNDAYLEAYAALYDYTDHCQNLATTYTTIAELQAVKALKTAIENEIAAIQAQIDAPEGPYADKLKELPKLKADKEKLVKDLAAIETELAGLRVQKTGAEAALKETEEKVLALQQLQQKLDEKKANLAHIEAKIKEANAIQARLDKIETELTDIASKLEILNADDTNMQSIAFALKMRESAEVDSDEYQSWNATYQNKLSQRDDLLAQQTALQNEKANRENALAALDLTALEAGKLTASGAVAGAQSEFDNKGLEFDPTAQATAEKTVGEVVLAALIAQRTTERNYVNQLSSNVSSKEGELGSKQSAINSKENEIKELEKIVASLDTFVEWLKKIRDTKNGLDAFDSAIASIDALQGEIVAENVEIIVETNWLRECSLLKDYLVTWKQKEAYNAELQALLAEFNEVTGKNATTIEEANAMLDIYRDEQVEVRAQADINIETAKATIANLQQSEQQQKARIDRLKELSALEGEELVKKYYADGWNASIKVDASQVEGGFGITKALVGMFGYQTAQVVVYVILGVGAALFVVAFIFMRKRVGKTKRFVYEMHGELLVFRDTKALAGTNDKKQLFMNAGMSVYVKRSLKGKLFRYGNVILTLGGGNAGQFEMTNVKRPNKVRKFLRKQILMLQYEQLTAERNKTVPDAMNMYAQFYDSMGMPVAPNNNNGMY